MKRRLAAFILILGPLQGFLCQMIQVFQVPEVHATPGSDVTLPCTYNMSGVVEAGIGSYKWYKHLVKTGKEVSDDNKDFIGQVSRTDATEFISRRAAHITIHNVDPLHAGKYFCQVTFQHGKEISGLGNGTLLNVTDNSQKTFDICILLKVAGFLLIVLTGVIALICKVILSPAKRSLSRSRSEQVSSAEGGQFQLKLCPGSGGNEVQAEHSKHEPQSGLTPSLSWDQLSGLDCKSPASDIL